jgi:hypothetical protein
MAAEYLRVDGYRPQAFARENVEIFPRNRSARRLRSWLRIVQKIVVSDALLAFSPRAPL